VGRFCEGYLDAGEEEKKKYGRADGAAASVGFAAPLCFF